MRLFLPLLLLLLPLSLSAQKAPNVKSKTTPTVDLAEALRGGLVAVEIAGLGGHQGEALQITCRNRGSQAMRLRIPQGQLLEPGDSSMQTLVVAEAHTRRLDARTPLVLKLRTFCAQAGDRSPMAGAAFAVGALAPERVLQLLKFLVENGKIDSPDAQQAVWCLTDNEPLGSIGDPELKKITAQLSGRPEPGYRVRTQTRTIRPGEPALPAKPLLVEGHYEYTLTKPERLTLILFDAAGKEVYTLYRDKATSAGEHRSGLRFEVYNLPPGKYSVKLFNQAKKVLAVTEVEW